MIPREVVQTAFRFEETAIVPFWIPMTVDVLGRLDEHYGSLSWRKKLLPYLSGWHVQLPGEDLRDGTHRDSFGTITESGNIMHILQVALPEASLKGYEWPDPESNDWQNLARKFEDAGDSYRLCGFGMGLFERAWLMRGMNNLLIDMIEHPAFVEELMEGVLDIHLRVMDIIAKKIPIEAYFGGDDWSDQRGPIMGMERWRQFIKPRLAKIITRCHEHNLPYICHSCGNVMPLVNDLVEIGMDGLESLQPEAMNIYELKGRTAGKMVLIGGMGTQSILPFGTPERVRAETQKLIREMGQGGGYVLAPSKPVMEDVPTENAVAFVESACGQNT